ncbi:MAG: hypothetical protein U1E31_02540 [Rickettsiales bacterium]
MTREEFKQKLLNSLNSADEILELLRDNLIYINICLIKDIIEYNGNNRIPLLKSILQFTKENNIELFFKNATYFNSCFLCILEINDINIDQKNELISSLIQATDFFDDIIIYYFIKAYQNNNQIDIYNHFKLIFGIAKKSNNKLLNVDNLNSYLSDILKLENINIDQKNELASLFLENTKFVQTCIIHYLLDSYKNNNEIDIYNHLKKVFKIAKKVIINY